MLLLLLYPGNRNIASLLSLIAAQCRLTHTTMRRFVAAAARSSPVAAVSSPLVLAAPSSSSSPSILLRGLLRATVATHPVLLSATGMRAFTTYTQLGEEAGFTAKFRNINVVHGTPKPATQEGEWKCTYPLNTRMEVVVKDLMKKGGWSEKEMEREMAEFFTVRDHRNKVAGAGNVWVTVEDFQRTPWYRRYRPNDSSGTHFVSIELMKLLEENLVPPSQRKDPYAHLRKRHYEDSYFNERYTEETAKTTTRASLNRVTKGEPGYGTMTRKDFMGYDRKYNKENNRYRGMNESYLSWLQHRDE